MGTKRMVRGSVVCALVLAAFGAARAEETDVAETIQEVKKLAEKSAALIAEKGEKAYPALMDPDGEYVDGELYAFVIDFDGKTVSHVNRKLIGKSLLKLRDVNGKHFMAEFIRIGQEEGKGWVAYVWNKPGETTGSPKVTYVVRVPEKELVVGVGIYDITLDQVEAAGKE